MLDRREFLAASAIVLLPGLSICATSRPHWRKEPCLTLVTDPFAQLRKGDVVAVHDDDGNTISRVRLTDDPFMHHAGVPAIMGDTLK